MDLIPELKRQQEMEALQQLQHELLQLMRRHDPLGFSDAMREVEYVPEVETILPRVREAEGVEGLEQVLREEFAQWRGPSAAAEVDLRPLAADIARVVDRVRPDL